MYSITDLLDLEDEDIIITDSFTQDQNKIINIETVPAPHFCPCCSHRMYSKGVTSREIRHPILQDGYSLILHLKQRRWKCTNQSCGYTTNDSFKFVNKRRRTTNATDMLIVNDYRNLMISSVDIASKYHVSDTYVHEVFNRYVKMNRLPLTDAISVDEVFLDMDSYCKYALVIQDFHTGDPIDLLPSRRKSTTEPYFASIPLEERRAVKYLISDMYNPYLHYVDSYFPNAVSVVDSFHVMQWILGKIDIYIRKLLSFYKQRDKERQEAKSYELGRDVSLPMSSEVYLLSRYKWLILTNRSSIVYRDELRKDQHLHELMNTYDYEDWLFNIDPLLREFRDLKELYVEFNHRNEGNPLAAAFEIDEIISTYRSSRHEMFREFASLLEKFKNPIINSFVMVEKYGPSGIYTSRLSNGPIESINRKVKDLKRLGRGFRNFEHFRNRFLFSCRKTPTLNGATNNNSALYFKED